ncbi:MAG: guanylate kinase [Leptospira sp.]|nr:guanylate kinase [Leptospira sp.]
MPVGKLYIISSVAGGGKSTLIEMLLKKYPEIKFSISVTSRLQRPGDIVGESYKFISKDEFEELIKQDYFIEWAVVHGNYYGTPKKILDDWLGSGEKILLDIDVQGAASIKAHFPDCVSIFILPPSEEIWMKRLRDRGTDSPESIEKRIRNGKNELERTSEFDYRILNDDLKKAFSELEAIVISPITLD